MRAALAEQVPLIWFYGVEPSIFNAIFPVWLTAEEPEHSQFVLALTDAQLTVRPNTAVEETFSGGTTHRRDQAAPAPARVRQPGHVGVRYTPCAVCSLGHRELLDAAHIIPDNEPLGLPVVPNGLALCKIHHAAYDRNILGIRPDYVIEVHQRFRSTRSTARCCGTDCRSIMAER